MEDKKLSQNAEQTASADMGAVIADELKKLENFSGTIEIPLPAPAAAEQSETQEKKAEPIPGLNGLTADDFKDFENLLWGGNMPDAPVINFGDEYVVTEGEALPENAKQATVDEIVAAIRTVEDPELMLNVYDLGLIYRLDKLTNGDVEIDMTVTAPSCPVAGLMPKQVAEAVSKSDGTGIVTVRLVWEPAWTIDKMTEEAKYALNLF